MGIYIRLQRIHIGTYKADKHVNHTSEYGKRQIYRFSEKSVDHQLFVAIPNRNEYSVGTFTRGYKTDCGINR